MAAKKQKQPKRAAQLNLARSWRPQTFSEVVGQEISVNMLQNSLFKNHFFPVYLFSGQRGCGKTTSARIFATAVNCEQLAQFQKSPKKPVPCLSCPSCTLMQNGTHPDFIEIDAASHTGVDDVRSLLESCAFLPLQGSKKVYLIDEAHMLSRAAFNAFLKILEEPPPSVLFLLATTEIHKIPDTVRSRCFQLLFSPIPTRALTAHLETVCAEEKIDCTPDALELIVNQTDGSARDALNMLEQVRFCDEKVTTQTLVKLLGGISSEQFYQIFTLMLEEKPDQLVQLLREISFEQFTPQRIWQLLLETTRDYMHGLYGVTNTALSRDQINAWKPSCSRERLQAIMQLIWSHEALFRTTAHQHIFLEQLFIQIAQQVNIASLGEIKELFASGQVSARSLASQPTGARSSARQRASEALARKNAAANAAISSKSTPNTHAHTTSQPTAGTNQSKKQELPTGQADQSDKPEINSSHTQNPPHAPQVGNAGTLPSQNWALFISQLQQKADPFLFSLFSQTELVEISAEKKTVTVSHPQANSFITGTIENNKPVWQPLLQESCGALSLTITSAPRAPESSGNSQKKNGRSSIIAPPPPIPEPGAARPAPQKQNPYQYKRAQPKRMALRPQQVRRGTQLILDEENRGDWPFSDLLQSHFPGTLTVYENRDE